MQWYLEFLKIEDFWWHQARPPWQFACQSHYGNSLALCLAWGTLPNTEKGWYVGRPPTLTIGAKGDTDSHLMPSLASHAIASQSCLAHLMRAHLVRLSFGGSLGAPELWRPFLLLFGYLGSHLCYFCLVFYVPLMYGWSVVFPPLVCVCDMVCIVVSGHSHCASLLVAGGAIPGTLSPCSSAAQCGWFEVQCTPSHS